MTGITFNQNNTKILMNGKEVTPIAMPRLVEICVNPNSKKYKLMCKDSEGGDNLNLCEGSLSFCEQWQEMDAFEQNILNIAVEYEIVEIV